MARIPPGFSPGPAGSSGGGDELPDSVVNRWPIDEGSGTTFADAIGTADGTWNGGSWVSDSSYIGGFGYSLDGTDDNGDTGATMPAGSMGLGITVDFSSTKSTFQYITAAHNGTNEGGRQIRFNDNGDLYAEVINDSGTIFSTTASVSTGRHRVWMILDVSAPELRLAIDGSVVSTTSVSGNFQTQLSNHAIGYDPGGSQFYLQATVDEPMVDSDAPTSQDLTDDYDRQPWS